MKELTYFKRHVRGINTDNPRILYVLKGEFMRPIERDIERYWRAYIADGRFIVNTSDDHPSLPLEALDELAEIHNDWIDMMTLREAFTTKLDGDIIGSIPLIPQSQQDAFNFSHQG